MAIVASERTGIQKLVIAMFNAAPGGLYLNEFTGYYEGAANRSLSGLADILGQSSAFKALYPSFQTAAEFATAILTPYGLQANQESIDFVTSKFATTSKAQIALQVGIAVDSSTSTNATLVAAKAVLANKATVSEQFSVVSNNQATTLAALQAAVSQVTAATSSIATQNAANAAGTGPVVAGVTFALTTGADFVSPSQTNFALKSTAGNDTFLATTDQFLTTADNIDGGDGIDTITVLNSATTVVAPILKSVEVVNITQNTTIGTFSSTTAPGITNINVTATKALTLAATALTTVVGFAAGTQAEGTTVAYANAAGTNDSATVSFTSAVQTAGQALSVALIENLTITNTGLSTISSLAAADAKSIVVTGTGGAGNTLTIGGDGTTSTAALTTFNASGYTGALTVNLTAGTQSAAAVTYTGSVGVNTVTLSNSVAVNDTIVFTSANASTLARGVSTYNNFNTSGDKVDLKAFALGADTTVGATILSPTADVAGFFTGTNRVVLNAGTTTVYVDVNKDGNFNAASDIAVVITGATAANFTVADLTLA